ncbi:cyclic nucleotide-binding domain-containing protein [bacterium]|nr:cyclic nucleotide-binding domain-containing protein [bacterium]
MPLPSTSRASAGDASIRLASEILLRKRDQPRLTSGEIAFKKLDGPLYVDGVRPTDPRQGFIGDCYLLCAFSALARSRPQLVESMIHSNGDGIYDIAFYRRLGDGKFQPETVRIDGKIPVTAKDGHPIYVRTLPDVRGQMEIWPMIAEKAFAAWKGGYHIMGEGGAVEDTLEELTGKPTRMLYVSEHHPEVLWKMLALATREKWPTTVCTWGRVERPGLDELGMHPNHIHIFLGVHALRGRRIVWLRDPFDKPTCGKLNLPDPDGVFTLSWENFLAYFGEIHINGRQIFEIPSPPHPSVTIMRALERSYVFHALDLKTRRTLARDFKRARIPANEYIFTAGSAPDFYYLIQSGAAGVEVRVKGSARKRRVAVLNAGDQFGEMALINNSPRAADVKTITPLVVYKMAAKKFQKWISSRPDMVSRIRRRFELQLWMQKWSKRPITSMSLDMLLAAGKEKLYRKGEIVFRRGDVADSFYVILDGRIEVFTKAGQSLKRIKILHSGDIFGEGAALKRMPRSAWVRAVAPSKLLRLDIGVAENLMESFEVVQRQLEFIARRRFRRLKKVRGPH